MKTLYLTNSVDYNIMIDGPSLWVRPGKRAGFRIPLRSIDNAVINANENYDWKVISTLLFAKIPVLFYKTNSSLVVHSIPYLEDGYLYEIPQRVAKKNKAIFEECYNWLLKEKKKTEMDILTTLLGNADDALNENDFKSVIETYYGSSNINIKSRKYIAVKKFLSGILRQIIIRVCIENGIDPRVGIYHQNNKLGMVVDISFAMEAELDLIATNFFKLKQELFWEQKNWLSNTGIKMLVTLYEKRKNKIRQRVLTLVNDIKKIIF